MVSYRKKIHKKSLDNSNEISYNKRIKKGVLWENKRPPGIDRVGALPVFRFRWGSHPTRPSESADPSGKREYTIQVPDFQGDFVNFLTCRLRKRLHGQGLYLTYYRIYFSHVLKSYTLVFNRVGEKKQSFWLFLPCAVFCFWRGSWLHRLRKRYGKPTCAVPYPESRQSLCLSAQLIYNTQVFPRQSGKRTREARSAPESTHREEGGEKGFWAVLTK